MLRITGLALGLLVGAVLPAQGQESPEAAAKAYGDAIRASDWATAARMMHPEAITQLRNTFEPLMLHPALADLSRELLGVNSAADVKTMADTVFYASFLKNATGKVPGYSSAMANATLTLFGHVAGGADTVLVVSRINLVVEGVGISEFEVVPFKLLDGRWRPLLKADMQNMAAMMQRQGELIPPAGAG